MRLRGRALAAVVATWAAMPTPAGAQLLGTCEVTGYGVDSEREGAPTNMRATRNQPCWFDMRFGAEGLMLTTAPGNGRVEVQGARVTYTPARNFSGEDQFVLQSRGPLSTTTGRRRPNMQFRVHVIVSRS